MNLSWTGTSPSRPLPLFPAHRAVRPPGLVGVFVGSLEKAPGAFPAAAGSSLWGQVLQEGPSRGLRPSGGRPRRWGPG